MHLRAWRGSRNLLKSKFLPQNHNPLLPWASISSCQQQHQLWIIPWTRPRVPNPTGTLPCSPGLADNSIPPATSSALHKPGLAGLPPSSGNTLEMFTGCAPPPSCQKGLQDSVQIPKSWVHVKKRQNFSIKLSAGGCDTQKFISPKIFRLFVWILDLPPRCLSPRCDS